VIALSSEHVLEIELFTGLARITEIVINYM